MKKGFLALAGVIRRALDLREKNRLCGRCIYFRGNRCLSGGCVFASGSGGPPFQTVTWSNLSETLAEVKRASKVIDCLDAWPRVGPTEEKVKSVLPPKNLWVSLYRPLDLNELNNPNRSSRIPEDRRIHLWNSFVDEKLREFELLKRRDVERQAMTILLEAFGIEVSSEDSELLDSEQEVEVADPDIAELKSTVDSLTQLSARKLQNAPHQKNSRRLEVAPSPSTASPCP